MELKTKLTYQGPLALYISYFVLLALSVSLVFLGYRLDAESIVYKQLMVIGIAGFVFSVALILHATQINRSMNTARWRREAETYYNDEGIFEYTADGFAMVTQEGESIIAGWSDIVRAESGEEKVNNYIKKYFIRIYYTQRDFITVDSTMPGFSVFEKRLKENLRSQMQQEPAQQEEQPLPERKAKIS
jgi:hypothetical protein